MAFMKDFDKKIAVVVNEKVETGKVAMAMAHAMLGFGAGVIKKEDVQLITYNDADGGIHANISAMPIVVLKANSNKIRGLRKLAIENNVQFVDFTESMSIGTYEEELALTKTIKEEALNYWAIIIFGKKELVTEWTKKFSLYR